MNAQTQSRVRGGLATAGSFAAILAGMVLLDHRVRDQVQRLVTGHGPSAEMTTSALHVHRAALLALDALRAQSVEHASLTIFALAATVLLLVMLRT